MKNYYDFFFIFYSMHLGLCTKKNPLCLLSFAEIFAFLHFLFITEIMPTNLKIAFDARTKVLNALDCISRVEDIKFVSQQIKEEIYNYYVLNPLYIIKIVEQLYVVEFDLVQVQCYNMRICKVQVNWVLRTSDKKGY